MNMQHLLVMLMYKNFKTISVYGAGGWGSALACQIARNYSKVPLFARRIEIIKEISSYNTNSKYLGADIKLPSNIVASNELEHILSSDVIIISVPSYAFIETIKKLKDNGLKEDIVILIATKGLSASPASLFSEQITKIVKNPFAFISGPNFAREVAKNLLTPATIASNDINLANHLKSSIESSNFIVTTTTDITTIQISGAVKNIIAIKSGIYQALGHGENAKAGLITDGLKEIMILSDKFGGRKESMLLPAVMGDLMLTCYSRTSRNTRFGYEFALSDNKEAFLKNYPYLVEGVESVKLIMELAKKHNIRNLDIISSVWGDLSPVSI